MPYGDGPVYDSNSSPASYLTPGDFVLFVDPDLPCQALSDAKAKLTVPQLLASPVLAKLLMAASGRLEAAALVGERYGAESLNAMTGVAQAHMQEIVANVCLFMCYARRDGQMPPENVVFRYQEAERELDRLRQGDEVFSFRENERAGVADSGRLNVNQILSLNLLSSQWPRFFGERQNVRGANNLGGF